MHGSCSSRHPVLGVCFSSSSSSLLFLREFRWLTDDALLEPSENCDVDFEFGQGNGGRVPAVIGRRVIPRIHAYDPRITIIPNAARRLRLTLTLMDVRSLWRAVQWKIEIYRIRTIPTITTTNPRRNRRRIGMIISKWRHGIIRLGSREQQPRCLHHDDEGSARS